ncbi:MAG: hypothetical protein HZC28_02215 [Spirochaetes bacterium]|nr:hypothetical protein [Spirochaetota bacterium]
MAKITCKECGTINEKVSDVCTKCSKPLYHDTKRSTAVLVTLILDVFFIIVYAAAIFLYIRAANDPAPISNAMAVPLPYAGSAAYYVWLFLFGAYIFVRVLFLLNHFTLKNGIIITLRRVIMFAESVTMFPVQSILALYFYNPATKKEKQNPA